MSARSTTVPSDAILEIAPGSAWSSYPKIFAGAGVVCLIAAFFVGGSEAFAFSYLVAYMFGLSLGLGALFFVIVQFLVKAGWSVVVRRLAENVMMTLPVFALLFIPAAIGFHHTHHHWWHYEPGTDPILDAKSSYLNVGSFFLRAVVYFVVWGWLAWRFWRMSTEQDRTGDHDATHRMQRLAPVGLILFAVTVTFASIDWMKSMEPHWFSTIWGVYYFSGCLVAIFAMMVVLGRWLQRDGLLNHVINVEHYHDLGKLLFGFMVFWSYIAFSQYFLIWYANIPEETAWFKHRAVGGWGTLGQVLMIGHFALPFLILLPRGVKRHGAGLFFGAVWMLVMHYLDLYYLIMPVHHETGPHPGITDVLTIVGIMGIFIAAFGAIARKASLIPVKDPRLAESVAFENT